MGPPGVNKDNQAEVDASFSRMEAEKRRERRRRYRETTMGERLEAALDLSELAADLRSGMRQRR